MNALTNMERCDALAATVRDATEVDHDSPLSGALWHAAEGLRQLSRAGNGRAVEDVLARMCDALTEED